LGRAQHAARLKRSGRLRTGCVLCGR
jgi:hypothetical protein